jgi:hypothetical protein
MLGLQTWAHSTATLSIFIDDEVIDFPDRIDIKDAQVIVDWAKGTAEDPECELKMHLA